MPRRRRSSGLRQILRGSLVLPKVVLALFGNGTRRRIHASRWWSPCRFGRTRLPLQGAGEQTGGRFAIVEHPIERGVIVEPHIHRNEDELSYVLEGTISARVGDQEVEAVKGSYVWKPRGVLHTFWNPGPAPARIMEVISPGGFERLFEQIASLLEHPTEATEDEVYELCRQYGLSLDRSWLPDLEARFGPMRVV
jgi:quercetin dioxygenase-like cupin family protein